MVRSEINYQEQLARISPRCIRYSTAKTAWKVMFLALLSSVLTYYGIFQLLVPYILSVLEVNYWVMIVAVLFLILTYGFALFLSVKYKMFNAVNLLLLYGALFFVSMTGILVSVAGYLPFTGYEILELFLVVLLFNSILIVASFYITRMVVCRVNKRKHSQTSREEEFVLN